MKRRQFIAGLGSASVWPVVARAQQAGRVPTIGFLGADASVWRPWTDAFVERLHQLGWIEGRTSRAARSKKKWSRMAEPIIA